MPILIIGLGNPLVTDDSVGLRVAAELRDRLAGAGTWKSRKTIGAGCG